jgi:hypothetical protein
MDRQMLIVWMQIHRVLYKVDHKPVVVVVSKPVVVGERMHTLNKDIVVLIEPLVVPVDS